MIEQKCIRGPKEIQRARLRGNSGVNLLRGEESIVTTKEEPKSIQIVLSDSKKNTWIAISLRLDVK